LDKQDKKITHFNGKMVNSLFLLTNGKHFIPLIIFNLSHCNPKPDPAFLPCKEQNMPVFTLTHLGTSCRTWFGIPIP